ncbi:MAG: ABC transporter ATP-binding protein [Acidobacteriota bacterium]
MNTRLPDNKQLTFLGKYLRTQQRGLLLLATLLIVEIGLQLISPQILRNFIDTALAGTTQQRLTFQALLFIGVSLTAQAISVINVYLSEKIGWAATNTLRSHLSLHCLRLDLSFHKRHTPGELIERIDGDVTTLSNFFSQFIGRLLSNALLIFGVLLLLFWEEWRIGLAVGGFLLLSLTIIKRTHQVAVPGWLAARQTNASLFGFIEEGLTGINSIRANAAIPYAMHRLYMFMRARLQKHRKARLIGAGMFATITGLLTLNTAIGLLVGAYLYISGSITIGTVYLIFHYTEMLRTPIGQVNDQLQDYQKATAGITRIQELFHIHSDVKEYPTASLPYGPLAVSVNNISFAYDDSKIVLNKISFRVQAGKVLGLLGRTGSGKSTLANLLVRLYDPQSGTIKLGDVDINRVSLANLRQRVGIVTQNVQLFQASLRDNVAIFDRTISDEQILSALAELGLWQWYRSLPDGLDTILSSQALSAGQAQLVAFARVLLRKPGLVVLDEASSRLDPSTENMIERAVDTLLQDCTAIIIAHRLGTVARADDILILDNGSIREYGIRSELAGNQDSYFSHMLRAGIEEILV